MIKICREAAYLNFTVQRTARKSRAAADLERYRAEKSSVLLAG
jgi:hypothetical protein